MLGIEPVVTTAEVDETPRPGEPATELVSRLARRKAVAGWRHWVRSSLSDPTSTSEGSGWLVIAADTVVERDGSVFGKPEGKVAATQMLVGLSGNVHRVHSGVAVGLASAPDGPFEPLTSVETTNVFMRTLDPDLVDWYVATGEPLDKAGGYGIQGKGSLLVDRIEGCYPNVVGLPLLLVDRLCRQVGWPLHRLSGRQPSLGTMGGRQ